MLLCAEDDDLDLVALVHLARLRGLDFEVRPGIEIDDEPLIGALDETPRALLVVVRSEHLGPERVREIESTFALARTEDQDLISIHFERRRVGECLETIANRLEALGCDAESWSPTADASTGRLVKVGLPIDVDVDIDVDADADDADPLAAARDPAEFEITVRADMSTMQRAADPVRAPTQQVAAQPPSRKRLPWAFGIGASTAVAAGALWLGLGGGPEAQSAEVDPTSVAPTQAVEVIDAPVPEPAPEEAWPPPDDTPALAPTPLRSDGVVAPDVDDIVIETAEPPRKHKRRHR